MSHDPAYEPAFPIHISVEKPGEAHPEPLRGITVRDYFAAKAMQSTLSIAGTHQQSLDYVAVRAYAAADAMLKIREEK